MTPETLRRTVGLGPGQIQVVRFCLGLVRARRLREIVHDLRGLPGISDAELVEVQLRYLQACADLDLPLLLAERDAGDHVILMPMTEDYHRLLSEILANRFGPEDFREDDAAAARDASEKLEELLVDIRANFDAAAWSRQAEPRVNMPASREVPS